MDPHKHNFPSEIWKTKPTWEMVLKIISVLPIFIIGTLTNASLIHVIARAKALQTTTNLLIVNMSIADLVTCLICPWMFLCTDLYQRYIMDVIGCRLDGMLVHTLTLVAVFNLSAISYDRVSAIVFNCSGKLTERTTKILLCATWFCGITLAAPLAYFRKYYERQWKDYLETYCTEDTVLIYPYWHIIAGLSVWAPLAIMAICYSAILIKLGCYETQALKNNHPVVVRYKGRVAQILALIVLAFILCRVPFTALIIKRAQLIQEPDKVGGADSIYTLWYTSRYLVLVNAAINPLLYGYSSTLLRRKLAVCPAVSWLICQKKRKMLQTSNVLPSKPQRCNPLYLRSRSPYIGMNDKTVPNISSGIANNNN